MEGRCQRRTRGKNLARREMQVADWSQHTLDVCGIDGGARADCEVVTRGADPRAVGERGEVRNARPCGYAELADQTTVVKTRAGRGDRLYPAARGVIEED